MPSFFSISLCRGEVAVEALGMLEFASLDDVRSDVRAASRDAAADLVRRGCDPAGYAFLIADEDGAPLATVPLLPRPRPAGRDGSDRAQDAGPPGPG